MTCAFVTAGNTAYRATLDKECPGWRELAMVPDAAIRRAARAGERAAAPFGEGGEFECACGAHGWGGSR